MNTIFGLDTETTKESYKKGSLMSIQVYSPEKNNSVVFTRIPGTENWEIYLVNSEKVLEDQISRPPRDLSIKVDVCSLGTHLEPLIKKRKEVYTTKAVKEFFQKKQMKFVTHNGYFDHYVLLRDLGISVDIVADTYIMAIMIPSRVNDLSNLQDLMQRHFDRNYDKARYGEWEDFDWSRGVYSTSQILYGSQDAMATYILYQELLKKYGSAKQDFFGEIYKMELSLIPIFSEMRMKGILVDKKRFQDSLESFKKESEEKIRNLYALRGKPFKINSAAEVAKWLYEERGNVCPIFSRKTRKPSASAKALDMLDDPVVKDLRDARESDSIYRALEALNQSDLPEDLGNYTLWHPEFKPLSHTRGSRIYTSDPSVNQWNWEVRSSVVPREGKVFYFADISAFEMAYLAKEAGETSIIEFYNSGKDFHRMIASSVFGKPEEMITDKERETIKVVEYATVYGSEGGSVAQALRIPYEDATKIVQSFLNRFPKIRELRDKIYSQALRTGCVRTKMGRWRRVIDVYSASDEEKSSGCRAAFNFYIQSGAGDLMKKSYLTLGKKLREIGASLEFTVFDSFLIEMNAVEDKSKVDEILKEVLTDEGFSYRFKSGVGRNWREAKYDSEK